MVVAFDPTTDVIIYVSVPGSRNEAPESRGEAGFWSLGGPTVGQSMWAERERQKEALNAQDI